MNDNETATETETTSSSKSIVLINSPSLLPIVDAHMHIQSNDIAPLPIMNGILRLQLSKKGIKENKINFCELSFRKNLNDSGKYSYDFDPDSNNIIFNKEKIKTGWSWSLDSVNIENRETLTDAVAGFFLSSSLPNNFIGLLLTPITAFLDVTKYGQVARQCSFLIGDLYQNQAIYSELAYPSRWVKDFDSLKHKINCLISYLERKILVLGRSNKVIDKYINWYNVETSSVLGYTAKPSIACIMGMELMYAHYWGAYGIPIYIYSIPNEVSEEISDKIYTIDNFPKKLNFPYDLKEEDIENLEKKAKFSKANKYNLFLKEIPISEKLKFENHEIHVMYQKMIALKYPLSFLPFYHVDPRRFFSPELDPNNEKSILSNFNFYLKNENSKYVNSNEKIKFFLKNDKNKLPVEKIYKELLTKVNNNIDNSKGLFWGIKLYTALGYPPYIGTDDEATYKIYPLLNTKETEQPNTYEAFTVFLENCAKHNIPITCHCSPQGMTIADSEIYLKEYLKKHTKKAWTSREESNFEPSTRGMLLGLGLIDDFSSPESWKIVLDKIENPLTLCLAHFGGKPFFTNDYKMMSKEDIDGKETSEIEEIRCNNFPYSWQISLAELISNSKHNIYTDLSNYMFSKVIFPEILTESEYKKVISIIEQKSIIKKYFKKIYRKDNVFYKVNLELNDLSYYDKKNLKNDELDELSDKKQSALQIRFAMLEVEILGKQINRAAENLSKLLKDYNKLKDRIMYGTDFPMFETKIHGIPNYQVSTFIFYQLLSHKLFKLGIKFDAWHQFTIINPLKFLGLLKEENGKMYFNMEKIKIMKEHLLNNNKDLDNQKRDKYKIKSKIELESLIENSFNNLNSIKDKMILKADEILDINQRFILTGE